MKTTLYLGTNPTHFPREGHLIHYPVIKIVPRALVDLQDAYANLGTYTHLIFTSKNTVQVFFAHLKELGQPFPREKQVIAIGDVTAFHLEQQGVRVHHVAQEETQEGLIAYLQEQDLEAAHLFLPRSSRARAVLTQFLQENKVRHTICDLYDTHAQRLDPVPDLSLVHEIVFTSPSTVEAFKAIYGRLPRDKKLIAIGPVTEKALRSIQ